MSVVLAQVISGGQTGVDVAALRAARGAGLQTGGWMPKGWRTLAGPRPQYLTFYGMREHASASYPSRTHANVRDADATLRMASDFDSPGEMCTWQGIVKHRKFHLDVQMDVLEGGAFTTSLSPHTIAIWIFSRNVVVLNVAGNSERTTSGIEAASEVFLSRVFAAVLE